MRTIKKNILDRLVIQAKEAETQGLVSLADALTTQIEENKVREDAEPYSYPQEDLQKDLTDKLWSAAMRVVDFYDIRRVDAVFLNDLIQKTAESLTEEIRIAAGVSHGVGAYEQPVPGETVELVDILVEED